MTPLQLDTTHKDCHNYTREGVLLELCAREKAGMDEHWIARSFSTFSDPYRVLGRNPLRSDTTRLVSIFRAQFEVWIAYHERKTGRCTGCDGTGTMRWRTGPQTGEWASQPCHRCGGSGKPKEDQSFATVEIIADTGRFPDEA
jgi:hypothetical protein